MFYKEASLSRINAALFNILVVFHSFFSLNLFINAEFLQKMLIFTICYFS